MPDSDVSDSDISNDELLALLVENRAAIDVLFEMMAFNRADGAEEEYRRFLRALRARHDKAVEQYRGALDGNLPELDPNLATAPGPGGQDPRAGKEETW